MTWGAVKAWLRDMLPMSKAEIICRESMRNMEAAMKPAKGDKFQCRSDPRWRAGRWNLNERKNMHYKNGRAAKNGDKVILFPSYGSPITGVLYDAVAGNDTCNGRIAATSPNDPMPNLKEVLHFDDVKAALGSGLKDRPDLIPDSSVPQQTIAVSASTAV